MAPILFPPEPLLDVTDIDNGGIMPITENSTIKEYGAVLLVEDEAALRFCVTHLLQSHGYSVLIAESGEQALTIARESAKRVKLLISDINLSGMSGETVFQILSGSTPGLKAILMSGYLEGRESSLESVTYLQKPFGMQALMNLVQCSLIEQ
jgi:DNA-binding NtrC family response regulator